MNFYIDQLILWLKNGKKRVLHFENDKINVITGNSKTGKTAILEIIDYCLCGSEDTVVISDEHIGENVDWYGIRFIINDKTYTLARGAIEKQNKLSSEYYFSQVGDIPDIPDSKMSPKEVKAILEKEFSIDDRITLTYGGRNIRSNSKLSFRYFLMMNTLSKDTIDNGKVYFDKLNIERYREVWPQVFDLTFGVTDLEKLKTQKKIADLNDELDKLETKLKKADQQKKEVQRQMGDLVKRAQEADLLDSRLEGYEAEQNLIRLLETNTFCLDISPEQRAYDKLLADRKEIVIKINSLKRFQDSYAKYRTSLRADADALQPIQYIRSHFSENIGEEYQLFLEMLDREYRKILSAIETKRPFEFDVSRKIADLKKRRKELDEQ
ncbi:MAG: AAA family ATPase, partial [Eubacteriales bacterium]|nr:AAA family ATPase [Eubacteriales bacterium]